MLRQVAEGFGLCAKDDHVVGLSRQRLEDSATRICGAKKQTPTKPKRKLKKVVSLNRVAARASAAEAANFAPAFTLIKSEAGAAGGPPMRERGWRFPANEGVKTK